MPGASNDFTDVTVEELQGLLLDEMKKELTGPAGKGTNSRADAERVNYLAAAYSELDSVNYDGPQAEEEETQ